MSKNKDGREVRKPKQPKKPKITTGTGIGPMAMKLDATMKKAK